MAEEVYSRGKIEDDIRAGRPEGYFDYIYKTYGTIFQAGSIQGLETFRELLRANFGARKRTQHSPFRRKTLPFSCHRTPNEKSLRSS